MGKLVNVRHDILRSYYNENDKTNSDFDHVYPITLFDDVKENLTSTAKSLSVYLNEYKNEINVKIESKQSKLRGTENNIAVYSKNEGIMNEIPRIETIDPSRVTASNFKIPTESAVVKYVNNDVFPKIDTLRQDISTKVTELESSIANNKNSIDEVNGRVDTISNSITSITQEQGVINTKINDINSSIDSINEVVNKIDNDGILDPDNPNSVSAISNKVNQLENDVVKKINFNEDGKYVKDLQVSNSEGNIIISELRNSVNNTITETRLLSLYSSDNSVSFTAENLNESTTRIDIKAVGSGSGEGGFVLANAPIAPNTKVKITYDAKGLVTGGADLAIEDLPNNIPQSLISGLTATINELTTQAGTALSTANENKTKVGELETSLTEATSKIDTLESTVNQHSTDINGVKESLQNKVDDSDFETLKSTVDTLVAEGINVEFMTESEFDTIWNSVFAVA